MISPSPLLAADASNKLDSIRWPMMGSPKLDGIRCLRIKETAVSRKLKPIPNNHIRHTLESYLPEGLDGEILIPGQGFNGVQSAVMSHDGQPEFEYHVFDWMWQPNLPYIERYRRVTEMPPILPWLRVVPQYLIESMDQCIEFEELCVKQGFEGVMLRKAEAPYKFGRSTFREGILLKVKRWWDIDGEIVGFVEQQINLNPATKDELGHTKRSSSKEGKVAGDTLGKLLVQTIEFPDAPLKVGTGEGLTHALRQEIWDNQEKYLGKTVTLKYQPSGTQAMPRFPIFKGFRYD